MNRNFSKLKRNKMRRTSLGISFLLSLPLSLGLPYVLLGLTFRFTTCAGGMFCLPDVLDFLTCLGFLLFAFPFVIAYFSISTFFSVVYPNHDLKAAPWAIQPLLPFTGFSMAADPILIATFGLALVPQLLFWGILVHLARITVGKLLSTSE